jgi:hypothetical protein
MSTITIPEWGVEEKQSENTNFILVLNGSNNTQYINSNSGLGDQLRTGFSNQNTMNTELYNDKVDKVTGRVNTNVT